MKRFFNIPLFVLAALTFIVYMAFLHEERDPHDHAPHDHSDVYHDHSHSQVTELPARLLFPSREPDRVILNLSVEPGTSLAVNWRTDTTIAEGYVEFAVAT